MFRFSFDCKDLEERYEILCDAVVIYIAGIFVYSFYFILLCIYWDFKIRFMYFYGLLLGLQYLYSFYGAGIFKE